MAKFIALHQSENRHVIIPVGKPFTFGRKGTCSMVETELAISGVHCTVNCYQNSDGTVVEISDSSSNGTFVNERLIGKGKIALVNDGDIIDLAKPKDDDGSRVPVVRYRVELEKSPVLRSNPTSPDVTPDHPEVETTRVLRDRIDEQKLQISLQMQRTEMAERKLSTAQEALHAALNQVETTCEEKAVLELKLRHSTEQTNELKSELDQATRQIQSLQRDLRDAISREAGLNADINQLQSKLNSCTILAEKMASDFTKQMDGIFSILGTPAPCVPCTLPDMHMQSPSSPSLKRARLSPVSEASSVADLADMLDIS